MKYGASKEGKQGFNLSGGGGGGGLCPLVEPVYLPRGGGRGSICLSTKYSSTGYMKLCM